MLTYDALIEQAKTRDMPSTKMRGILREYLQILILKELYKTASGRKLCFTGGTYLRLAHNFKRFSEDLDFNTANLKKTEFEGTVHTIKTGLKRLGIDASIRFKHWENIYEAHLVFPVIEETYAIFSRHFKKGGVVIKIETNRPRWRIKKETQVISGFGELYPCICTEKGALFADKVDALNKKMRGRHLYDIMFMLSNRFPIDKNVLSSLGLKGDPLEMIRKRVVNFSKSELKKQAETLRPFLFEESEADLLINAHQIIPTLLEKYRGTE